MYRLPYRKPSFEPSEAFPASSVAPLPLVVLTLRHGERRLGCRAIIDSGASFCLFPYSIGEELGLDVEKGKKASARTGEVGYFWDIEVTLEANMDFPLYAGFSRELEQLKVGLLGQLGFFDKFDVRFESAAGRIGLIPRSDLVRVRT